MIFEIEDETRDFITIYDKDFLPKKVKRVEQCRPVPHYHPPLNILNGPFKEYLAIQTKSSSLSSNDHNPDPKEFLTLLHQKYPWLKKSLPENVPTESLIESKKRDLTKTIYQVEISDVPWVVKPQKYKGLTALPEGWIVPESVQRNSYRDPWKLVKRNLLRVERVNKPPDNLSMSVKQREILKIRTGHSEYNQNIDETSGKIMKGRPLGLPLPVKFKSDYEKRSGVSKVTENL